MLAINLPRIGCWNTVKVEKIGRSLAQISEKCVSNLIGGAHREAGWFLNG
jgi:hypothetical protein